MDNEVVVDTIVSADPNYIEDSHLLPINTEHGTIGTSTIQDSQSMTTTSKKKAITICVIVFLTFLIILITSLVYVEYVRTNKADKYEHQSTRTNCSNNTFSNYTFSNNTFQRHDLNVLVSNVEGVSINLTVSFWYRLQKDHVSNISSIYGTNYETYLNAVSRAAVRNTAVDFSVNEFLTNRTGVRHHIAKNISYALSKMWIDCPSYTVRLKIGFSSSLLNVHLWASVTLENNIQKANEKDAYEIRAETNKSVEEYLANADNITRMAEAYKTAEVEAAQAKYDEIIVEARYNSSRKTMDALGIVNSTDKEMFLTLMGILDNTTYIP